MEPLNAAADLGYQTNRLARLLRAAVAKEVAPLGLTARQTAVILQLAEAGAISMGDLAERIGVDKPTLTGIVERLSRDGWLRTEVNEADRRKRLVTLTLPAAARVRELGAASSRASRAAVSALTPAEARQLLDLLGRAADALQTELETEDRRRS